MSTPVRPSFPARAVVTAGMPYGNKELHFGHVGGLFVHADVYARFLRDRIGPGNVIFVSGTDCYGSAIEAGYEAKVRAGEFEGSIQDFVRRNHDRQEATLRSYGIVPDLYAASSLDEAGGIHAELSREVFEALYSGGYLVIEEARQFFDNAHGVYLNGRQVTGRCPIQGCKSEVAYADECALGHQFSPDELIAPVSALSGERPELRGIKNWYLDMERFRPALNEYKDALAERDNTRRYLVSVIEEFLRAPSIYVKREVDISGVALPEHEVADEGKPSVELVFSDLADRARAASALSAAGIRFRTGKTLVPFRISGNVDWGIPVPEREGVSGRTFWCWPESLWAPISFTKAVLGGRGSVKDWWASEDAEVYQFIGEDNIYFYSVAQTGLFMALRESAAPGLKLTTVVPNRHVLFMKKKAASSGAVKPPSADELLTMYSKDQLRLHFFHMNLGTTSVGFAPGALSAEGGRGGYDPVEYEGNLLTNIFNRLLRSCFYTLQKHFAGRLPKRAIAPECRLAADRLIADFEWAMYRFEFGRAFELLDQFLRGANKLWAERSTAAESPDDWAALLNDTFHAVRVALTLIHPLAPEGAELAREYLRVDERIWDWKYIYDTLPAFFQEPEGHVMKYLEPRVDFFDKPRNK